MSRLILALGLSAAAGAFVLAGNVQAQTKTQSACNKIAEETACKANAACTWIAASTDSKTGKQKRKAYCKTKPKAPAKKKAPDKKAPEKK